MGTWLVIWLEGMAVMTMGQQTGMSQAHCEMLQETVINDISSVLVENDQGDTGVINEEGDFLLWGEYEVTCESKYIQPGTLQND